MTTEKRWPIEVCGACGHIVGSALLSGAAGWCPATGEVHKRVEAVHVVPEAALAEIRERLLAYSDRLRDDPGWPVEAADAVELAAGAILGEQ